jgi:hypothetical protein
MSNPTAPFCDDCAAAVEAMTTAFAEQIVHSGRYFLLRPDYTPELMTLVAVEDAYDGSLIESEPVTLCAHCDKVFRNAAARPQEAF